MDKYEKLMTDIRKIIDTLTIKINEKEQELDNLKKVQEQNKGKQNKIIAEHKDTAETLKKLKFYENKKIPLYVLNKILLDLIDNIKEEPLAILAIILFVFIAFISPLMATIIGSIILGYGSILTIILSRDIFKLRKKYNILDLENKERELEEELLILIANISEKNKTISTVTTEIIDLKEQRQKLYEDFTIVESSKKKALNELVSICALDQTFNEQQFSDIIIRTKRKKEGEE